jgi:hypothetical protein
MNLQSLDVVIGMVIVFLAVSLICSSVNELLSSALSLRANTLKDALDSLLGSELARTVLDHSVIPAAPKGGPKSPAYIEPALFASALLDTVMPSHPAAAQTAEAPGALPAASALLARSPANGAIGAFVRAAGDDYKLLHQQVSEWYDAYMDRVSGAYKRNTQAVIAVIAICVVGILNVDSFKVYKQLTNQGVVAAALAAKGDALLKSGQQQAPTTLGEAADNVNVRIAALPVPIGWHRDDFVNPWWQKVVGLLVTMVAASLGAPFWFDALSKLANLRSVGAKPGDS